MSKLNWSDLHYYLVAVQSGTFTAAAKELGVNRTTVGRRIATLESELGTPLFELTHSGYTPTEAGHEVLATANRIEDLISSMLEELCSSEHHLKGSLKVAAPLGLGPEFMAEFAAFGRTFKDIRLELINTLNPILSLGQRKADIAIAVTNYLPEHISGECIGELQRAIYASQDYLTHYPAELPLNEHQWVGWGREMADTVAAKWMSLNLPMETNICTEVNSWHAMKEAVLSGLGVGQLWCFLADEQPTLERIRPADPELGMGLWVAHHAEIPLTARAKAFTQYISAQLSKRIGM